jgi:hypothetical protein
VRRLNAEVAKLIADPAFNAKFLASQGLATDVHSGESPEAFGKFIREGEQQFRELMRLLAIRPE